MWLVDRFIFDIEGFLIARFLTVIQMVNVAFNCRVVE